MGVVSGTQQIVMFISNHCAFRKAMSVCSEFHCVSRANYETCALGEAGCVGIGKQQNVISISSHCALGKSSCVCSVYHCISRAKCETCVLGEATSVARDSNKV